MNTWLSIPKLCRLRYRVDVAERNFFFRYKSGTSRSMGVNFHCRIYVHFEFVFNMSKNDSFVEISGFKLNSVRHFVSWNPANDGLMLPQDHL